MQNHKLTKTKIQNRTLETRNIKSQKEHYRKSFVNQKHIITFFMIHVEIKIKYHEKLKHDKHNFQRNKYTYEVELSTN